ncbi:MAG: hypothetical protein J2P29_11670, partial [Actinobacteria bacterium]|nr:hypothetical protein [Actinomycetota bacterium]
MDGRRILNATRSAVQRAAKNLLRSPKGVLGAATRTAGQRPDAARRALTGACSRWRLVVSVACVLSMAAGVTVAVLPSRGSGLPGNAGILAPGSQGSLPHHSWWDPRGWFGGSGAPSSTTLPDATLALPSHSRMPAQKGAPPAHRVREITGKRSQY